jgi:hypothetical protein
MREYIQTETAIPGAKIVTTERDGETVDVMVAEAWPRSAIGASNLIEAGVLPDE